MFQTQFKEVIGDMIFVALHIVFMYIYLTPFNKWRTEKRRFFKPNHFVDAVRYMAQILRVAFYIQVRYLRYVFSNQQNIYNFTF